MSTVPQRLAGPVAGFCERHFLALVVLLLVVAGLNVGTRLHAEIVTEWDEAMYALTASEIVDSRQWVATTIRGELDYYNTKPPLNVWLIALSFKAFGKNLTALRIVSACSAWLTVVVLVAWAYRMAGPVVALIAGAALTSNFGFLHVHAGRSGNPDALLTLLILLTVVALWAAQVTRWHLLWLGPLLAGVFLLKGTSVVMPLAIIAIVEGWRSRVMTGRWVVSAAVVPLFISPVALWAVARWEVDGWEFLRRVFYDDFIGHGFKTLDGHAHSALYYFNVLQKHEYAWLAVAAICIGLTIGRGRLRSWWNNAQPLTDRRIVLAAWGAATLLMPSMMGTKLPWYLNPFYPAFALGAGWLIATGLGEATGPRSRTVLGLLVLVVFLFGEARLFWYSVGYRSLSSSPQGLLLAEKDALAGQVVFGRQWDNSTTFVAVALGRAQTVAVSDLPEFLRCSGPGDLLLWDRREDHPSLELVRTDGQHWLYRRL